MKYRDLFGLTVQRIELLIEKTRLSHQEFRNIGFSGEEVERDVRLLLSEILPSKYEVKHGYVAYALNSEKEPVVSPQVDVIIVDSAVPGTLFVLDSTSQMELVAGESVVGIIEVKRTLSRESLLGKKRVAASADHPSEAGPKVTEEPLVGKMFAKPDRSATDVGPVKATDIVCDEFRFVGIHGVGVVVAMIRHREVVFVNVFSRGDVTGCLPDDLSEFQDAFPRGDRFQGHLVSTRDPGGGENV